MAENELAATCVNEDRTVSNHDTKQAQPSSWIVRDPDDNPWGPFDSLDTATKWAEKKWPDIPQYGGEGFDNQGGFWDVEALRPPGSE